MNLVNLLIFAVLGVLLLVLAAGLYALFRGGDFGRSYSNKLMRLRVLVQFIAILLLAAVLWWRSQAGA
ncbi:twin transmembrane helix small protein [Phenylobacterium sp. VNQ135]|uniref:twin transmembrane helix small protein n=1 Tax=Phenylobacterium sp. VNQ135 TaxID=3400922 RepID=UPI003BFEAB1C